MIRKSLVAALVASFAVMLTAAPAAAGHGGSDKKYCDRANTDIFEDTYC